MVHLFFLLALATSPPDSVVTMPTQEVRGARISPEELADRRAGAVTVLDQSSWQGGAHSAASVLSRAAGVSVREQGGVGS